MLAKRKHFIFKNPQVILQWVTIDHFQIILYEQTYQEGIISIPLSPQKERGN